MNVDLFTHSPVLEATILEEYGQGQDKVRLFPDSQHHVDKTTDPHLYCFYDLDPVILSELLKNQTAEYELRNSRTGELLPKDLSAFIENLKHH